MKKYFWILLIGCSGIATSGECQSNVFSLLRDQSKVADKDLSEGNYVDAIKFYERAVERDPYDQQTKLKLAQAHYMAKNYQRSIEVYNSYLQKKADQLPWIDLYNYAEAQSALKHRELAQEYYKKCLAIKPDNDLIAKKIWRLNNINYLYEDSSHYVVWPAKVNTKSGELCAVPYKDGIVFTSNRKESDVVDKVNGKTNTPFYQLYSVKATKDTTTQTVSVGDKPLKFGRSLKSRYNTGPVAFFDNGSRMVFVTTNNNTGADGSQTLGLYFASLHRGKWKVSSSYPHNSAEYSISDVTISSDGAEMYFSSDMKGGLGKKDIYQSKIVNGRWSRPTNVGEAINTVEDEVFPYLFNRTLYFSSDGHAGIGELDIFKVQIKSDGFGEPQNPGYPLNSSYDDFGVSLDSLGTHGYFSSNRKRGGLDDDIYEFDMDLQTYPFTITGVVKYKEHALSDQSTLQIWPNVKVQLIDSWQNGSSVFECTTDDAGKFSITVPYFSKYYLLIVDEEGNDHKASFEIMKYKAETNVHEIVVVKDIFRADGQRK